MSDNLFEAQYDVTKKSKLKKFYELNKIIIFSSIFIIIVFIGSFSFYLDNQEKKKVLLSENYLQAKIFLEKEDTESAINLLKEVIFADDPTYSSLSLFLIINQNLITDNKELLNLFDHLLDNNKFSKEVKNLLIYKKALLSSNFVNEHELLESIRPLINSETEWKSHALILLGDYFVSKGENTKAVEFYQEILTMKNLQKDFYNHASLQLAAITNE